MITTIIASDPVAILELIAVVFTLVCIIKLSISAPEQSEIKVVRTYYHPAREIFRKGDLLGAKRTLSSRSARFRAF